MYQLVYEGWKSFEETCSEVGVGELPQLLRYLKMATTPTPTPTPTKMEAKEQAEEMEAGAGAESTPGTSGQFIEKPIHISVGGITNMYKCGNCDITPKRSRMGMDSHICAAHTKKALVCSFCPFSTYNMDSLQRHEREHK